MISELRGVNFRPAEAKAVVKLLTELDTLSLRRDPDNQYDSNAIAVYHDETGHFLGFVAKEDAADLAPQMDDGTAFTVTMMSRTGPYGILLDINPVDEPDHAVEDETGEEPYDKID